MRLHTRLYLHFLLVLGVAGVTAAVIFAIGHRGPPARELGERMARHAAALAAEGWPEPARVQARLGPLHRDLGVAATARDLAGRVVAAGGTELPPLAAEADARVRAGATVASARRWAAGAPIHHPPGGPVVGTVVVSSRQRPGGGRGLQPLLALAAALVAVGVATRPLARRISRPVERLTEAARRLGAGDLAHRVPPPPPGRWRRPRHGGELEELTGAFNEMAERIERLVAGHRDLLANVSHELRSPLARVRVALELLPRTAESEGRLRDLEADLGEVERLIDDLLTTSRLEATGRATATTAVDARALLETLAARAARDPRGAGDAVRVAPGPAVTVRADPTLLERALWNLVDNALKHGAPPVTLEAAVVGGEARLAVVDAGPGIPAAERPRVLEPFYTRDRARTPAAGARGYGLGLTIARRVAEAHGGRLTIEPASTAGGEERGCRVSIMLPTEGPAGP